MGAHGDRRQPPGWLLSLLAPGWVGAAVGLVELGRAWPLLPGRLRPGLLAACCVGFGILAALVLGPAAFAVRRGLELVLRPPGHEAPEHRAERLARLSSVAAAAALFAQGARHGALWVQRAGLKSQLLGAWALGLALLVLALASLGAFAVLRPLVGRGLRRAGAARVLSWALLGLAAAWVGRDLGAAIRPAAGALPWRALAHWGLFGLALLGASCADRLPAVRVRWLVVLGPPAALLALGAVALHGLGQAPSTQAALFAGAPVARVVVQALRRASDRDGDGYSSLLGGGDCDDSDRSVSPAALEKLGNDVDENCDGLAPRSDPTLGTLSGRLAGPGCATSFRLDAGTNVLLLVIDAVRADRLDPAYPRDVAPALHGLVAESVLFERCYTPHPSTAYAFPSLFTGVEPRWARDLMKSQRADIPPERPLLQELLSPAGYRSAAIYGHYLAGHRHRMTRGIDYTSLREEKVSARGVARDAERFIDTIVQRGAPFFVYAQFHDPHWPYEKYAADPPPWPQDTPAQRYDAEVRNVDRGVAALLEAVRRRGLLDKTLLVVVADHGEELGEHGGQFHGQTMFEEVVHVPCLVRAPGLAARRVAAPVSLVDVVPTVLDLLGLPWSTPFQGVSLEPLALGQSCRRGPVVGEMQPWNERPPFKPWLWMLVEEQHKIVYDVGANSFLMFDLFADPAERTNLVEIEPALLARLRAELAREITARVALPPGSDAARRLAFR
ncbi:MAG: sulfatase-like hydrolase/transferase [Deltaproteobacteria bacterium]|nr:sulfatase-like hydrolase/transferase [Deltaproteobacteria bacterium]